MSDDAAFDYVAFDGAGRKVRGRLNAPSPARAFEALKAQGLAPLKLTAGKTGQALRSTGAKLRDQDVESLFADMGALLGAGADIRAALNILAKRADRAALKGAAETLTVAIGGGTAVDIAVARVVGPEREVLSALLAAGEAGGDLPGGFQRGAELLASRRTMRQQLVAALSYPAFVLVSTLGAIFFILFFVIPSLAPLVDDAGQAPPVLLAALLSLSRFLQAFALPIAAASVGMALAFAIALKLGLLSRPLQRLALAGPWRRTTAALIYGGFAWSLGNMLSAGASMADALRLSIRTVSWSEGRDRLAPVLAAVRQGEDLSDTLNKVTGFPLAISRLAAVGEATGALGPMLTRSGQLEEAAALKEIERAAKVLGPVLIVVLGSLIGLLMASLLSGLTSLGEAALQ